MYPNDYSGSFQISEISFFYSYIVTNQFRLLTREIIICIQLIEWGVLDLNKGTEMGCLRFCLFDYKDVENIMADFLCLFVTEDIDPSVGRFRNMVQTAVVPIKVKTFI